MIWKGREEFEWNKASEFALKSVFQRAFLCCTWRYRFVFFPLWFQKMNQRVPSSVGQYIKGLMGSFTFLNVSEDAVSLLYYVWEDLIMLLCSSLNQLLYLELFSVLKFKSFLHCFSNLVWLGLGWTLSVFQRNLNRKHHTGVLALSVLLFLKQCDWVRSGEAVAAVVLQMLLISHLFNTKLCAKPLV